MKKILRILQPYLLAVAPLATLFRNNPGEVFFFDFLTVVALFGVSIWAVSFLFCKWTKDQDTAFLSISILYLCLILSVEIPSISPSYIWFFCALTALVFLKTPLPTKWKSRLSYSLSLPLLIVILYNLIEIGFIKKAIQTEITQRQLVKQPHKLHQVTCSKDIYIIILDEFISEKSFKEYYHYDNDQFFDYLRKNKFQIISSSTSNYPWTIPSISSILNFTYHQTELPKNVFTGVAQFLIKNNQLFHLLKQEGYTIHHIPSIYWMGNPSQNPIIDFLVRTRSYGLIQTLAQITPWKNAYRTYQRNSHRAHVLNQLDTLKQVSEKSGKKLAFAHIMCPHRPIAFREDGTALSKEEALLAEKDSKHTFYLDQAKFLSKEVMKTVDHILRHSEKEPIIFLLSDHGKFPIGCSAKGKPTLPIQEIAWRFSNLQALYLPDFDKKLPDHMTPINTVRTLLHHYFGYDLPLLEESCCLHFHDLNQKTSSNLVLDCLSPKRTLSKN